MTRGLVVDAVTRWGCGPVSFVAEPGMFVVLAGPRGAGKSTLIGCVAGFDRPDEGAVMLNGEDVHSISTHPDPDRPWLRSPMESTVGWLAAVVPLPGRSRRHVPALVCGDEPEAPFVSLVESPLFLGGGWHRRDRRVTSLLDMIRSLCEQGAVVVTATHSLVLIDAADQVVNLCLS